MASAAVATSASLPHLGSGPVSRTSSSMDQKKTAVKQEETVTKSSPTLNKASISEPHSTSQAEEVKLNVTAAEPLAPPPKPSNATETPDYFSGIHNPSAGSINQEFNPFEQSFGAPSSETPGKTLLPGVAALASPAIPGTSSTGGYNWQASLRSGPLSPAMLPGPQQGDYFDSIGRGFPTPNESSLRTGLTPGGGGSMFPAPSPNSQAIFNQLQSGGATPGTLDFHRTAMNAAARGRNSQYPQTSNPQDMPPNNSVDAQHDATDAANGLFMLAKGAQASNQFAVPNQSAQQMQTRNGRTNTSADMSANGDAESPEESSRPNTRPTRGKKPPKAEATPNNRRKSEQAAKGSNKKSKGNSGLANMDPALGGDDDDDDDDVMDSDDGEMPTEHPNGRKMTDEEKRRNFLERNRVAALKCRQRKKQWLANLQAKVEMYSAENETLNQQVGQLHEEVRNLRTLLMGHKDCPVGHAQGIGNFLNGMQDPNQFQSHVNPYGMAGMNGGMQAGMQRS